MAYRQISAGGALKGQISVPGDKSVSHRALILGALAAGRTKISGLAPGADVRSTWSVLKDLGVKIEAKNKTVFVSGRGLSAFSPPQHDLDAGNSGTTMRLMTGVLAGQKFFSRLVGDPSLSRRPMERVAFPLNELGADIQLTKAGTAPILIRGQKLTGKSISLQVPSAQVKSAILLAGLHASGKTSVQEPVATRDHTEKMLELFGVKVLRKGLTSQVLGKSKLKATQLQVPGDPSSAAFWAVAATLASKSKIKIKGTIESPLRTGFIDVLERMGAKISRKRCGKYCAEDCEDLTVESAPLKATYISAVEVPGLVDEVPILALAASQAQGQSRFYGLDELRHKESDRLKAIVELLIRFGAKAKIDGDDLIIDGPSKLVGANIDSYKDHRLAMTAFVAGFIAKGRTTIIDADCAEISYPSFYTDFLSRIKK